MSICYIFLNSFLRGPNIFFIDNQINRIPYIVKYLIDCSNFNGIKCIGLSEIFGSYNIQQLNKEFSKYGYILYVPNSNVFIGSGLGFAYNPQEITILNTHFKLFSKSCFPDSFASKGYLHILFETIETPKQKVNCIVTHIQSTYSFRKKQCEIIQKYQLKELNKFIESLSGNYILMGDLNVNTNNELLDILKINDTSYPKDITFHDFSMIHETLDYILTNVNSKTRVTVANTMLKEYIKFVSKKVPFISDHFAIFRII